MNHSMNLHTQPFEMIESGIKTIELRLCDEKRRKIKVGDTIVFSCGDRTMQVAVTALYPFDSFEALYRVLPLDKCGYLPHELETASAQDMQAYYSLEQQKQYGVLGIEIERLP